jgi:deazaflavin-dependent oxidoreductase (nitroreductase family)
VAGGDLAGLADEDFCYLTTTGRRTGKAHTIEIWFGARDRTLYLLSGGGRRSDWVRNLEAAPDVRVRIAGSEWPAVARIVSDGEEGQLARRLLASKYQGWREGAQMSGWARTALPVAVDLRP